MQTEPMTTEALLCALGWSGDACPNSKKWISDGRMALRLDFLDERTLRILRHYPNVHRVARVDEYPFEARVKALVDVIGTDRDGAEGGCVGLVPAHGQARPFDAVRLACFAQALPGARLYLARVESGPLDPRKLGPHAGARSRELPAVAAYTAGGDLIGLLMGRAPEVATAATEGTW